MLVGNNDFELGITLGISPAALRPAKGSSSPAVVANLGDSLGSYKSAAKTLLNLASDMLFTCPSADAARRRVNAGIPAWRYRYMGIWNNTALSSDSGAYHGSEIPLIFGTSEIQPSNPKDTPEQIKLAKIMRHAWAEFAKDPEKGLTKLGWPIYDTQSKPAPVNLSYYSS
jgi:carboxylesterase type B